MNKPAELPIHKHVVFSEDRLILKEKEKMPNGSPS